MPRGSSDGHGRGDLWVRCEVERLSEDWAKTVDLVALEKLLPPKRKNVSPLPDDVEEADYSLDDHPPAPQPPRPSYEDGDDEDEGDYGGGGGFYDDEDDEGMDEMPQCQQQ